MEDNQKDKISRILIWLGLLAWPPYIVLQLLKIEVRVFPFWVFHLIGVLGGILMRPRSEEAKESTSQRVKILKKISTGLLAAGVSVWGVYFSLEWITGMEREITPFLIAHLSGVLSGAGIKTYNFFARK